MLQLLLGIIAHSCSECTYSCSRKSRGDGGKEDAQDRRSAQLAMHTRHIRHDDTTRKAGHGHKYVYPALGNRLLFEVFAEDKTSYTFYTYRAASQHMLKLTAS